MKGKQPKEGMIIKDFSNFEIKDLSGNVMPDLNITLGNVLYVLGKTIRIGEIAKQIFKSEVVEMTTEERQDILNIVRQENSGVAPLLARELEKFLILD